MPSESSSTKVDNPPVRLSNFRHYVAAQGKAEKPRHADALISLTSELEQTYSTCSREFHFSRQWAPRRVLTKPDQEVYNDSYDNANHDYICRVNDVITGPDGETYEIEERLGCGTFGQVLKCNGSNGPVALKIIKNKPAYFQQALVEVRILQVLANTGEPGNTRVVRMLDYFVFRKHLCIVFELLSWNMYELLKQNKLRGLKLSLIASLTEQLLNAMDCLRQARIIHCDLKPENILFKKMSETTIKLIDFGSACFEGHTVHTYIQSRFYRSPEVLLGVPYNLSIDMWSLGCICAELYLGLPLFPGTSEFDQMHRIVEVLGIPPRHLLAGGRNTKKYFVAEKVHTGDDQEQDTVLTVRIPSRDQAFKVSAKNMFNTKTLFAPVDASPPTRPCGHSWTCFYDVENLLVAVGKVRIRCRCGARVLPAERDPRTEQRDTRDHFPFHFCMSCYAKQRGSRDVYMGQCRSCYEAWCFRSWSTEAHIAILCDVCGANGENNPVTFPRCLLCKSSPAEVLFEPCMHISSCQACHHSVCGDSYFCRCCGQKASQVRIMRESDFENDLTCESTLDSKDLEWLVRIREKYPQRLQAYREGGSKASQEEQPKMFEMWKALKSIGNASAKTVRYRLRTREEYSRAAMKEEKPTKRYFNFRTLPEMVGERRLLSPEEQSRRPCFLHFLQGILEMDPQRRWTPKQALAHPFITNAAFDGTFDPPEDKLVPEEFEEAAVQDIPFVKIPLPSEVSAESWRPRVDELPESFFKRGNGANRPRTQPVSPAPSDSSTRASPAYKSSPATTDQRRTAHSPASHNVAFSTQEPDRKSGSAEGHRRPNRGFNVSPWQLPAIPGSPCSQTSSAKNRSRNSPLSQFSTCPSDFSDDLGRLSTDWPGSGRSDSEASGTPRAVMDERHHSDSAPAQSDSVETALRALGAMNQQILGRQAGLGTTPPDTFRRMMHPGGPVIASEGSSSVPINFNPHTRVPGNTRPNSGGNRR